MIDCSRVIGGVILGGILLAGAVKFSNAEEVPRPILPEQRRMAIRDPACLPRAPLPNVPAPITVSTPQHDARADNLSLDDAIRIALANSEVIRVLGGSSGRTQYDPAIINTEIDQNRARFDPTFEIQNQFYRNDQPIADFDPSDPTKVIIGGVRQDNYNMGMGLTKTTLPGGSVGLGVQTNPARSAITGLPLNPENPSALDLSVTQPLLQGAGVRVNLAPIEIARIDTERSYFQLKDSVQEMVRGVIEAYWSLVLARTELWVRRQQVIQGTWAAQQADAMLVVGLGDRADVAQSHSALAEFKAAVITAEAAVLEREDTLRNILGLPPSTPPRITPVSPPSSEQLPIDWNAIVETAAERRPDLIELKLIIEAEQQRLLMARNDALPSVDVNGLYRWNGLEGRTPDQQILSSRPGQFTEWQLGVTFSVPLGLRQARATMRQRELTIMRDRANLGEGLLNATHQLSSNYRNLAQYYDQYLAYQETRVATQQNLEVQNAKYKTGVNLFLNVLQAITSWGNSVNSEAGALIRYNTELANLQRQTGVILDAHGIRFAEERYRAIGPLGRMFAERCYPKNVSPTPNVDQYQTTTEPAENAFNLTDPTPKHRSSSSKAPSAPRPPTEPSAADPSSSDSTLRAPPPERIPAPMPGP
jgi:outer membrane protein TolC